MRVIRSINNNIAVCVDAQGNELIAMGKGIGYGKLPREVPLEQVSRTYYNVDPSVLAGVSGVSGPVLEFAARVVERARDELDHELSPNLVFTLADHIEFALKRAREGIFVKMPLSYDVEQSYPDEYRIARQTVRRLRRTFKVALRDEEAVSIALNLVNARTVPDRVAAELARRDEEMLEDVTEIIENAFHLTIDRSSFAYSRCAAHMNYLFSRLRTGKSFDGANLDLYAGVRKDYPQIEACVDRIADHLHEQWGCELTDEERLYLFIHVNRICATKQDAR